MGTRLTASRRAERQFSSWDIGREGRVERKQLLGSGWKSHGLTLYRVDLANDHRIDNDVARYLLEDLYSEPEDGPKVRMNRHIKTLCMGIWEYVV